MAYPIDLREPEVAERRQALERPATQSARSRMWGPPSCSIACRCAQERRRMPGGVGAHEPSVSFAVFDTCDVERGARKPIG